MKPVAFSYQPITQNEQLGDAFAASETVNKIIAGGQSLGPMLNLRLVRPDTILDITRISDLREVKKTANSICYGACITHAEFEDGLVEDAACGMMQSVASHIAYRAVRNRGTIGGSLAHADPAADWVNLLFLLNATIHIQSLQAKRRIAAQDFILGAFRTDLSDDEWITAIEVPLLSPNSRWGYHKFCRKVGEFAHALGAVLVDEDKNICRVMMGAVGGAPMIVDSLVEALQGGEKIDEALIVTAVQAALAEHDAVKQHWHSQALCQAFGQAGLL